MAFLLAKPTPRNVNHDNDRLSISTKSGTSPLPPWAKELSMQCAANGMTHFMSTVPLAQPVGRQNEAAVVGGVAAPHLCAYRTPVQLEAKKLENLGEGRPSETASFDAVSQDKAVDNGITHFTPFGSAAAIEPQGLLARLVDHLGRIIRLCSDLVNPLSKNRH
jgi:hypothetical protein